MSQPKVMVWVGLVRLDFNWFIVLVFWCCRVQFAVVSCVCVHTPDVLLGGAG